MGQRAQKKKSYQHWNTPETVLGPLREFMPITLDPCSNRHSTVGADVEVAYPEGGDGLGVPWHRYGHTYANPPYNDQPRWMAKAAHERALGAAHITMLIPASTETVAFQRYVFGTASAVCFWRRRLRFLRDGAPGTGNTLPSALVYWGTEPERFAECLAPHGAVATHWTSLLDIDSD